MPNKLPLYLQRLTPHVYVPGSAELPADLFPLPEVIDSSTEDKAPIETPEGVGVIAAAGAEQ